MPLTLSWDTIIAEITEEVLNCWFVHIMIQRAQGQAAVEACSQSLEIRSQGMEEWLILGKGSQGLVIRGLVTTKLRIIHILAIVIGNDQKRTIAKPTRQRQSDCPRKAAGDF